MGINEIKKIAVVGAGTMGSGIAQNFAQSGYEVSLNDIKEDALDRSFAIIKSNLETFVKNNILTKEKADDTLPRISITTNLLESVKDADFVVETIFEVMDLKKEMFKKLDELCSEHTILASNSSTLSIDEMAAATKRPEKVILTHHMNPPHIIPLVEVVKGAKTSEETINVTLELLTKVGKTPAVLNKVIPGYLINTFNAAIFSVALNLLKIDATSKEDIDAVFKNAMGPRLSTMGPFEIMDMFGLDLIKTAASGMVAAGVKEWEPILQSQYLNNLVNAGNFGIKTGKGFYDYSSKSIEEITSKINERLFSQFIEKLKEKLK